MQQLDLLGPEPAAPPLRMPVEPIIREAVIEDNYRWLLKRAWGAGPCILWCGVNPSTADGQRDDPTMQREIGFSYRWGFGSLIKVNIYPFISANQGALRQWRSAWSQDARQISAANNFAPWEFDRSAWNAWLHNMDVVRQQLGHCEKYVAAWGNGADLDDLEIFLDEVQADSDTSEFDGFGIVRVPIKWHCLDKNADGSPKHTLARGVHRIPDDATLRVWR